MAASEKRLWPRWLAAAEGPRLQQAIGANCSEKDRTHERIRIEEGPIDRGKIVKLACSAMLVKECGRDRNHRGEINRAELRHDPESNQRQQHLEIVKLREPLAGPYTEP